MPRRPAVKPGRAKNAPSRLNAAQKSTSLSKADPKQVVDAARRVMAPTAQQSIVRQYGLVKDRTGKWVKPDRAFLERQLTAQGWGRGQTSTTPVMIGGMRWLTGQGQLKYTGKRSDAAKRNPGAAYGAKGKKTKSGKQGGNALAAAAIASQAQPVTPGAFASGVSASTLAFTKEFGQSQYAAGEAETAATKKKKKGKPKVKPKPRRKKPPQKKAVRFRVTASKSTVRRGIPKKGSARLRTRKK